MWFLLEVGELGLGRVPDFHSVGVLADQVFEVDCQGAAVLLESAAGGVDALRDVEDDGGEAVGVEVHFLVVGDFADHARRVLATDCMGSREQSLRVEPMRSLLG